MNLNEYQKEASKTIPEGFTKEQMIDNAIYGLVGEFGEVVDLLKKAKFQGHDLDKEKAILELGDVLWYLAELATGYKQDIFSFYANIDHSARLDEMESMLSFTGFINDLIKGKMWGSSRLDTYMFMNIFEVIISLAKKFDTTLEEVASKNIEKLRNRYGDKFDSNKSINRSE